MSLTNILKFLKNSKFVRYGIFNLIISIILFYIIFKSINFENSFNLIKHIDLSLFCLTIFLSVLQVFISNIRWYYLISKLNKVKFTYLFKHSYIICFLNQVLPSSIGGEAYKIFINKNLTASFSKSISLVLFEKYIVLLSLLFLILISNYFFNDTKLINISHYINFLILIMVVSILLLFLIFNFNKVKIRNEFLHRINQLIVNSIHFLKKPQISIIIFIISLIGHVNLLVIFKLLALSLSIQINILDLSYIFFIIFLFSQLPLSIGGWGIRETTAVSGLAVIGVHAEVSFAISTLFGVVFLITYFPAILLIYKDFDNFFSKLNN